ncbi:hypothetical protein EVAR_98146_1 [Eumeta japonica]|uniref:Uncharacterized protein n=1 Tax=Eumeta variegata TaxID=151549 RepID=A0A4C1XTJ0_EUMVA|nr:hypothetical protein EVAR_98146_1 [Eumeta japonica]
MYPEVFLLIGHFVRHASRTTLTERKCTADNIAFPTKAHKAAARVGAAPAATGRQRRRPPARVRLSRRRPVVAKRAASPTSRVYFRGKSVQLLSAHCTFRKGFSFTRESRDGAQCARVKCAPAGADRAAASAAAVQRQRFNYVSQQAISMWRARAGAGVSRYRRMAGLLGRARGLLLRFIIEEECINYDNPSRRAAGGGAPGAAASIRAFV